MNNITLIRFLKIYSIYRHLIETDSKQIEREFEEYCSLHPDPMEKLDEVAAMSKFINERSRNETQ